MRKTLEKAYLGSSPTGEKFDLLVNDIRLMLPGNILADVIRQSILDLAGQLITAKRLDDTCWRLAGNLHRLRRRDPVTAWQFQRFREWVPAQIMSARPARGHRGDFGALLGFKVMAGSCCPALINKFWSVRFCRFVSPQLGFARWPPSEKSSRPVTRQYHDFNELVTLRMDLLIDPSWCLPGEPGFNKIRCGGMALKHNKVQLKYRDRIEAPYECRFGYPRTLPCRLCAKGFVSCPAGCHARDYVLRRCECCKRDQAPFDPDLSEILCVECYRADAAARPKH